MDIVKLGVMAIPISLCIITLYLPHYFVKRRKKRMQRNIGKYFLVDTSFGIETDDDDKDFFTQAVKIVDIGRQCSTTEWYYYSDIYSLYSQRTIQFTEIHWTYIEEAEEISEDEWKIFTIN